MSCRFIILCEICLGIGEKLDAEKKDVTPICRSAVARAVVAIFSILLYLNPIGEIKVSLETNVRGTDVFVSNYKMSNIA